MQARRRSKHSPKTQNAHRPVREAGAGPVVGKLGKCRRRVGQACICAEVYALRERGGIEVKRKRCKKITLARFVFAPVHPVIAPYTLDLKLRFAVIRHLVTACPFGRFLPGLEAALERPLF